MRLCLAVALILAACTASGAEVTLRNDLRPRLEQLRPIYGEETNAGMRAPIIAAEGAEDGNYFDGLRVISVTGAIKEGVELSLKLFLTTLEKAGVGQVDPHGEPFDPQLHEAMAMVPNPDLEPNSVIEVMQKGYTLNGRLVRAAKVVVSAALSQDG